MPRRGQIRMDPPACQLRPLRTLTGVSFLGSVGRASAYTEVTHEIGRRSMAGLARIGPRATGGGLVSGDCDFGAGRDGEMASPIRRAAAGIGLAAAGLVLVASVAATSAAAATPTPTPTGSAGATTVMVHNGQFGQYLTDGKGRSVYRFAADTGSTSTCYGPCAAAWPPLVTTGKPTAGPGVNAADLGTTNRSDGTKQVTYFGHPLYLYTADTAPGMTNGQGLNNLGGLWWLVSPSGSDITTKSGSATATPHTSAPATGGGMYGH
jgi:predicted lipoprotein with Yx(FWY)xxD motif